MAARLAIARCAFLGVEKCAHRPSGKSLHIYTTPDCTSNALFIARPRSPVTLTPPVQDAIFSTAAVAVPRPCRQGCFRFSRSSVSLRRRRRSLLACSTWRRVCSCCSCSSWTTGRGCYCGCDPQAVCSQVRIVMCELEKGVTFPRGYVVCSVSLV